ncbi:hypothetical protein JCM10296v2_001585 [Rhodotorula toruloides]
MRSLAHLGQSVSAPDPPHDWGRPLFDLNPAALPDLPPIPDRALAELARTHKSSVTDLKKGTRSDNYFAELQSNGRLEWQGDAVLRYLISMKLLRMLEFATAGFLSEIRNRLVSNHTFSHIAWHYGLQDTLKTNPDLENRAPAMEQKTLAGTFEAYLGAVVSASGEDVLRDYVDKLLQPEVFPQLGALQRKLN